jgi:hypothetical protein
LLAAIPSISIIVWDVIDVINHSLFDVVIQAKVQQVWRVVSRSFTEFFRLPKVLLHWNKNMVFDEIKVHTHSSLKLDGKSTQVELDKYKGYFEALYITLFWY